MNLGEVNKRHSYVSGSSSSSVEEGAGTRGTVGGLGRRLGGHAVECVDGAGTETRAGRVLLDPFENYDDMPKSAVEYDLDHEPLLIEDGIVIDGNYLLKWSSGLDGEQKAIILQVAEEEAKAILVSDLNQLVGESVSEKDVVVYADDSKVILEAVIAIVPVDSLRDMVCTIAHDSGVIIKVGNENIMEISAELLKKLEMQGAIDLIKMSQKITKEGCAVILKIAIGLSWDI
ncbi:hypothetical protein AYO37_01120 [Opitutia bacterium SCGC AG-212-L18]|nr:hypothetical protein AYO37_01120 [Opitutae bacterium SCGC AG-212-L18]